MSSFRFICLVAFWTVAAAARAVDLPVEVLGPPGTTERVAFDAPGGARAVKLSLHVHGVNYTGKASVRMGDGAWIPLRNDEKAVSVLEPGKGFGGIGGGFQSLKLVVTLPPGAARAGRNTVDFRFDKGDGRSSGFRVLSFQLLGADGKPLLPASLFKRTDPSAWKPALTSAADLAAGKRLWSSAALVKSPGAGGIRATCADCHATAGQDLRYYNFSDRSIVERSKFHGLSGADGLKIASYIRSLRYPAYGRPWNPPYQPGPGLDAKPARAWAAGAGLAAALDRDADTERYLPGRGKSKAAHIDRNRRYYAYNRREIPIALQLLDWNHWLPEIHPKDALGPDAFYGHNAWKRFENIRKGLAGERGMTKAQYVRGPFVSDVFDWKLSVSGDDGGQPILKDDVRGRLPGEEGYRAQYAAVLWQVTKLWELLNDFEVQETGELLYGLQGEKRHWPVNRLVFNAGPHIANPGGENSGFRILMDSGQPARKDWTFLTNIWYTTHTILNGGQRSSVKGGHHDVDWKYNWYFTEQGNDRLDPLEGLTMSWKSVQELDSGFGPDGPGRGDDRHDGWWGWRMRDGRPELGHVVSGPWPDHQPAAVTALLRPLYAAWIEKMSTFPYAAWQRGEVESNRRGDYRWGSGDPAENYPDVMKNAVKTMRDVFAMDEAILGAYADLGAYMYPSNDWGSLKRPDDPSVGTPRGVKATSGPGQVVVAWEKVASATSYKVERSEGPGRPYRAVGLLVTGTTFTDPLLERGPTYLYRVVASRGRAAGPPSAPTGPVGAGPGLVLYYTFNEPAGPVVRDVSRTAAWGKLIGKAKRVRSPFGTGVALDGEWDFVGSSTNVCRLLVRDVTAAAWVRATRSGSDNLGTAPALFGTYRDPSDSPDLTLFALDGAGRVAASYYGDGTVRSSASVADGKWHHVAFVREAASGRGTMYVDGAASGSGVTGRGVRNARCFGVGRADHNRSEDWRQDLQYWPGEVDEVKIYNGAVTPAGIRKLMSAGIKTAVKPPTVPGVTPKKQAVPPKRSTR